MNTYRFADMSLGMTQGFSRKITLTEYDLFLSLSGDENPLHLQSDWAQKSGFQDRVAYGMMVASYYSTLVGIYLPGKFALLQGVDAQFNSPVYPGDKLEVVGEVVYLNEAFQQMELKASIFNQEQKKVSKAKIKVGFYGE